MSAEVFVENTTPPGIEPLSQEKRLTPNMKIRKPERNLIKNIEAVGAENLKPKLEKKRTTEQKVGPTTVLCLRGRTN